MTIDVSFLGVALFILYMLPWIIAVFRKHPQAAPIFVLNLFFGWTLLGWVGALAWAVASFRIAN